MEKRVVIVQCRLSSSRLPQKAIKNLGDKTVLDWVLQAMHKIPCQRYFVATDYDSYDIIKPVCDRNNFECFRGSLDDVLLRFVNLLETIDCDTVIRATADNPFLFYEAALESVELFENKHKNNEKCDYLTFSGLPHGSGVEIFSAASLKKAILNTNDAYDHEHVGPALYNHKDLFTCEFVQSPQKYNYPQLRTTIDTYSDYLRAVLIANYLNEKTSPYSYDDIISACQSEYVKNPVILYPSVKKGQGTGHLRRCLSLALKNNYFVYIPKKIAYELLEEIPQIISEYVQNGLKNELIINALPDNSLNATIITDNFKLSEYDIKLFSQLDNKKIISIDDDSRFDDYSDYKLDIIPPLSNKKKQNFLNPEFIEKPENIKEQKSDGKFTEQDFVKKCSILICFGGEDPAGLSLPVSKTFKNIFPNSNITTIFSKTDKTSTIENLKKSDVTIIPGIKKLKNELYKYDIVVTHYGLTAFEAFFAGCKVVLFSTTKLHEKLAQKYGFCYVKYGHFDEKIVKQALLYSNNSKKFNDFTKNSSFSDNFEDFVSKTAHATKNLCPVCQTYQKTPDKIVSRNYYRTYRRCQTCSIVYISFSINEKKSYEKSYFFEDYKKQYGKTYTEDFESIKKQGIRRLHNIQKISKEIENKNLLDIGCAYGPFLSAASDYKINPYGTDISQEAVSYVQNELHIPAVTAVFPHFDSAKSFGIAQFDYVTMWYVIEHFENLNEVLKKVSNLVSKNGIFAFSTPCGQGISAKSNKDNFYKNSPSDHYSVWEKNNLSKILSRYGFKVCKIVSTGHHPERFPYVKKYNIKSNTFRWKFIEKISKIMKLGDTMEVYCKKM